MSVARKSIWNSCVDDADISDSDVIIDTIITKKIICVDIYDAVLTYLLNVSTKKYITDQTPRNIFIANQILAEFPNLKIIHLVRNPRAVLLSLKNRWKQRKLGAKNPPFWNTIRVWINYHPHTITKLWIKSYYSGQNIERNDNYLRIKYEELSLGQNIT